MRTKNEFQQKVHDDLVWRRRELQSLKSLIESTTENPILRDVLLRSGVAILYAHWEGFVKRTGSYYLEFVSNQGYSADKLSSNFLTIKLKSLLTEAGKSEKISTTNNVIDFLRNKLGNKLKIPHKGIVDTQSNLSSKVLKEIGSTLGVNIEYYKTKNNLIDKSLVDRRNHIAHGDYLDINVNDYLALHEEVIAMIEEFRNQLENAVATDLFLIANSCPSPGTR
jgi:MAE_28990/MAE_18760-like HEPN